MILHSNGPSCGKSKRTSEELLALGYTATDVRRYQLGFPIWRALSLTVQTHFPGLLYIFTRDHTSVFVDARTPAEFAAGTIPGAVNVQTGEAVAANDDGRLPFRDKSTRVVVFGNTAHQANCRRRRNRQARLPGQQLLRRHPRATYSPLASSITRR